jgi:DNA-binding NarL/FixJ family response regulator
MESARIRVLCVDDSDPFTAAWNRLLSIQPDMESAGTLNRADELVRVARDSRADVVLLDLTMVGRDPLDALSELRQTCPEIKVVVCSGWNDRARKERASQAGASGYVDKIEKPSRILDVLRKVAGGEVAAPAARPMSP